MSIDRFPELHCQNCDRLMGVVSLDELEAIWEVNAGPGLCFDCEPDAADSKPLFFWDWWQGDRFRFGNEWFETFVDGNFSHCLVQSHARARSHERDSSSYTNLNRNTKKGVLLGNGYEVTMCPDCQGTGQLFDYDGTSDCSRCGGAGMEYSAVYIPVWMLGLGCENV